MKYWSIIAIVLCIFTGCREGEPTSAQLNNSFASRSSEVLASNNSYDEAGELHNAIIDSFFEDYEGEENLESLVAEIDAYMESEELSPLLSEVLEDNAATEEYVESVIGQDFAVGDWQDILDTWESDELVSDLEHQYLTTAIGILDYDVASEDDVYDVIIPEIKDLEDLVIADGSLTSEEEKHILLALSVLKYSVHYWTQSPTTGPEAFGKSLASSSGWWDKLKKVAVGDMMGVGAGISTGAIEYGFMFGPQAGIAVTAGCAAVGSVAAALD